MNDEVIEREVQRQGLTAPRVTRDEIAELKRRIVYITEVPKGTTSTFVHAFLDGQFYLGTGHSACVSKENFRAEIGEGIARDKAESAAVNKLWELEGYLLYRALKEHE